MKKHFLLHSKESITRIGKVVYFAYHPAVTDHVSKAFGYRCAILGISETKYC